MELLQVWQQLLIDLFAPEVEDLHVKWAQPNRWMYLRRTVAFLNEERNSFTALLWMMDVVLTDRNYFFLHHTESFHCKWWRLSFMQFTLKSFKQKSRKNPFKMSWPVNISQRMQPNPHRSLAMLVLSPLSTSGAQYSREPEESKTKTLSVTYYENYL